MYPLRRPLRDQARHPTCLLKRVLLHHYEWERYQNCLSCRYFICKRSDPQSHGQMWLMSRAPFWTTNDGDAAYPNIKNATQTGWINMSPECSCSQSDINPIFAWFPSMHSILLGKLGTLVFLFVRSFVCFFAFYTLKKNEEKEQAFSPKFWLFFRALTSLPLTVRIAALQLQKCKR